MWVHSITVSHTGDRDIEEKIKHKENPIYDILLKFLKDDITTITLMITGNGIITNLACEKWHGLDLVFYLPGGTHGR